MSETFRAIYLTETDGKVAAEVTDVPTADLPAGDVTVDVHYSTLNYKDGMIVNGLGKLVREYPHVPGIDFSGVVSASDDPRYKPGDEVLLTGWRVGEIHWGGLGQKARVKGDWLVPLPEGLDLKQAMAIGTAGFTAMLSVMALEDHNCAKDEEKPVLVTGAAGGVGSVAVALLAANGFPVAAVTGRAETHDYLKDLGATTLLSRDEAYAAPRGPLGKERWSGVIDNVGGEGLGALLLSVAYWGSVASVGNAGGIAFSTNVLPFLLRGINLLGIDSNTCPIDRRVAAWGRLAKELDKGKLDAVTNVIALSETLEAANAILKGAVRGRTVVDVRA
ncbi:MAG: MDR family oxidoreductase [Magnetovibrionaceae bacterium]